MLVKCLQQRIINILMRTYNISTSDAYDIWSRAVATKDERVCEILDAIIRSEPEGLPCIINRNPTISNPNRTSNFLYWKLLRIKFVDSIASLRMINCCGEKSI